MPAEPTPFGLPVVPLEATFCRVVRDIYPPLDTAGARLFGGRFNPPGVPALYLASDPDLALRESTRSADWAGFSGFAPRRVVCVRLRLSRVADLCDPAVLGATSLEPADLAGAWAERESPSPTQLFGEAALLGGVEAIAYPSALDPCRSNLVVFGDNLLPGSALEVVAED